MVPEFSSPRLQVSQLLTCPPALPGPMGAGEAEELRVWCSTERFTFYPPCPQGSAAIPFFPINLQPTGGTRNDGKGASHSQQGWEAAASREVTNKGLTDDVQTASHLDDEGIIPFARSSHDGGQLESEQRSQPQARTPHSSSRL